MSYRPIYAPEGVLDVPAVAGDGVAALVERFDTSNATVQFNLSAGTYTLQGSVDGSAFVDIQAGITAASVVKLDTFWKFLRVKTTVAGDAVVTLGAYEMIW
jgi:hypothetical protein